MIGDRLLRVNTDRQRRVADPRVQSGPAPRDFGKAVEIRMILANLVRNLIHGFKSRQEPQQQFDVAVVIQTVLRPSLERAVESVYAQDFPGRIQILVGIDKRLGDPRLIEKLQRRCPPNMHLTVVDPGYSTSVRHGSIYSNQFGGALRAVLTYLANSRYVAYLDDDDWFAPDHLATLRNAIEGVDWAFSYRWYVNPFDSLPICVDTWENMGPGKGIFSERFGGFVCPSTLMLDKVKTHFVLPNWCIAMGPAGDGEDRVLLAALLRSNLTWRCTGAATVFYVIKPEDGMHPDRERFIASTGYDLAKLRRDERHAFARV
ncbi:MAG TPA: glycosyltransferase family A protein [Rhodocyclaceae bacterium]